MNNQSKTLEREIRVLFERLSNIIEANRFLVKVVKNVLLGVPISNLKTEKPSFCGFLDFVRIELMELIGDGKEINRELHEIINEFPSMKEHLRIKEARDNNGYKKD